MPGDIRLPHLRAKQKNKRRALGRLCGLPVGGCGFVARAGVATSPQAARK
jgi:hypothetical protein